MPGLHDPAGDVVVAVFISILAQKKNMSADPNTLIAGATCIQSCIPPGMQLPVIISILAPGEDPNALMDAAKCIQNCIPDGMQLPVLISLVAGLAQS